MPAPVYYDYDEGSGCPSGPNPLLPLDGELPEFPPFPPPFILIFALELSLLPSLFLLFRY